MKKEKEVRKILARERTNCDRAYNEGSDSYVTHKKIIKILEEILEINGNEKRLCIMCNKEIPKKRLRRDTKDKLIRTCSHICSTKLNERFLESAKGRAVRFSGRVSRYGITKQEQNVLFKQLSKQGIDDRVINQRFKNLNIHLKTVRTEMREKKFPEKQILEKLEREKNKFKEDFEKMVKENKQ